MIPESSYNNCGEVAMNDNDLYKLVKLATLYKKVKLDKYNTSDLGIFTRHVSPLDMFLHYHYYDIIA